VIKVPLAQMVQTVLMAKMVQTARMAPPERKDQSEIKAQSVNRASKEFRGQLV
jgi:hypothetical protein